MLAITNARIITVTGPVYECGTLVAEGGRIIAVGGAETVVPDGAEVVDAAGKWLYPGLIDACTFIGLKKEPAKKDLEFSDDVDFGEFFTPQYHVRDAFDPFSPVIRRVRQNGVTACFTAPGSAGAVDGQGAVFKLCDGETAHDLMIPGTEQMCLTLGDEILLERSAQKKPPYTRMSLADALHSYLKKAADYTAAGKSGEDPAMDAMVPVMKGERKARFSCLRADDIAAAVLLAEQFGLDYCLVGAYEAHKLPAFLKEHRPDIILEAVPFGMIRGTMMMTVYDTTPQNAMLAEQAGCLRAVTMHASSSTAGLPFLTGFAVGHGLSAQGALEAVTIGAARVLGLGEHLGSLEPGKDADLALFDGDMLLNSTLCQRVWIDGKTVWQRDRT